MEEVKVNSHSPKFEKVRNYYASGLWTSEMVHNAAVKGWITEEEEKEIFQMNEYEKEQFAKR